MRPLKKKTKIVFQDRLLLYAGQKYYRMLPLEHSVILSTFIKLPFAIKAFVLSIFEWLLKTGFTVFKCTPDFGETIHRKLCDKCIILAITVFIAFNVDCGPQPKIIPSASHWSLT